VDESVYVVSLRRVYEVPRGKRAQAAIRAVREHVARHGKAANVKLTPRLSQFIWARGAEKPPRKIKVKVTRVDEETLEVDLAEEA